MPYNQQPYQYNDEYNDRYTDVGGYDPTGGFNLGHGLQSLWGSFTGRFKGGKWDRTMPQGSSFDIASGETPYTSPKMPIDMSPSFGERMKFQTSMLPGPQAPKDWSSYGAILGGGPRGSGQGFLGSAGPMTKAQFGQQAQGFADNPFLRKQEKPGYDFFEDTDFFPGEGVMKGGMFRKGSTGVDLANISGTKGSDFKLAAKGIVPGQTKKSAIGPGSLAGDYTLEGGVAPTTDKGLLSGTSAKEGASSFFGNPAVQGGMMAAGALFGGIAGFRQAKSQKKGLSAAIGELDPIKTQAYGAYEKMGGIAESYRPGGTYSRYMGGRILSQAEEAVGQESSRMIASGITSPSMMRQMGIQSRRQAQASLPGMEMQVSQMALPYEQLASGYFGEYKGLGEQMAGLKGARAAVNPWSSAISGAMSGAMGAATMIGSLASDRRMKKDIKYLHTSNEGHKVYSFKYKDGDTKYSGVMAQDVLKINPNAVTLKNGMLAVYYNMIDVDMQQLDII